MAASHRHENRSGCAARRNAIFAARITPTAASSPQNPANHSPSPTATADTHDSNTSSLVVNANSPCALSTAIRKLSYLLSMASPAVAASPHAHSVAIGDADFRAAHHAASARRKTLYARHVSVFVVWATSVTRRASSWRPWARRTGISWTAPNPTPRLDPVGVVEIEPQAGVDAQVRRVQTPPQGDGGERAQDALDLAADHDDYARLGPSPRLILSTATASATQN